VQPWVQTCALLRWWFRSPFTLRSRVFYRNKHISESRAFHDSACISKGSNLRLLAVFENSSRALDYIGEAIWHVILQSTIDPKSSAKRWSQQTNRVVAPMSVKGLKEICTRFEGQFGPRNSAAIISILKSLQSPNNKYSSTIGLSRWISFKNQDVPLLV